MFTEIPSLYRHVRLPQQNLAHESHKQEKMTKNSLLQMQLQRSAVIAFMAFGVFWGLSMEKPPSSQGHTSYTP